MGFVSCGRLGGLLGSSGFVMERVLWLRVTLVDGLEEVTRDDCFEADGCFPKGIGGRWFVIFEVLIGTE